VADQNFGTRCCVGVSAAGPLENPVTALNRIECMPASLSRDEVAHLADLARIDLTDAELDHLAPQLSVILESVASIQGVASADVPPTSHALPLTNVFREDVIEPCLTPEQALSGAPAQEQQRFSVPRILGDEQ
jgi:aspartyl-tRNA(Asn)/glutamyl-tRNA(Gln) amidotransferase subunit C